MTEGRYTPSPVHPERWVCRDCPDPRGRRIIDRASHDAWHDLAAEQEQP